MILEIGVTSAEHRRKPGDFHFAAAAFTWLFVVTMIADFPQGSFAVDSFFQPTQGFINGLTFL
jgi:hypothetical protein